MDLKELLAEKKKTEALLNQLKKMPLAETTKAAKALKTETAKLTQQLKEEK